jgi:hypothetical protein
MHARGPPRGEGERGEGEQRHGEWRLQVPGERGDVKGVYDVWVPVRIEDDIEYRWVWEKLV